MTNEQKYTAQEMRDRAESHGRHHPNSEIPDMLRQAADAEEENAQLKARLEAVVKECKKSAHSLAMAEECINKCYANVTNRSRTPSDACLNIANLVREYRKTNAQAKKGEGGAK